VLPLRVLRGDAAAVPQTRDMEARQALPVRLACGAGCVEGSAQMTPDEMRELRFLLLRASEKTERVSQGELAACVGKKAFATHADAVRATRRKELRPYHCRHCGSWHTGAVEGMRRQRLFLKQRREGAGV
jgi:hypothetical protein